MATQETRGIDIGDPVEVIVAGPSSLSELWAFDGCQGVVIATYQQKGEPMATVKVSSTTRSGKQWFPVRMLRRLGK